MRDHAEIIARETGRNIQHVRNVIDLIDGGATIPFIARYRKEMHGTMDDTTLRDLDARLKQLRALDEKREQITSSIEKQGKMTEELRQAIDAAETNAVLEDLYRPYREKRRTRAMIAREKGYEMLAMAIMKGGRASPEELAEAYPGEGTVEEALQGASDIIAEELSDRADIRGSLRTLMTRQGRLTVKAAKEGDSVYRLYYDFSAAPERLAGHQILAIDRGEKEGWLKVSLDFSDERAMFVMRTGCVPFGPCAAFTEAAARDAYKRLIAPSIEREIRNLLTAKADEGAIRTFADNLKPLLLQPPVKGSVTLGFDPAYRTGCKLAVIDGTGKVLETGVIYPTPPHNRTRESAQELLRLIRKHGVRHIAIGNGTASRESEKFVADTIRGTGVTYAIVNEAGASVYSASELGAKEFPEYDVSLRSAVSIARRLQDPLAELVKIDPKSIGVGQYQHDMPESELDESLRGVVEDCVTSVGVDVNTASPSLLGYVSGISPSVAKNIVAYREANGEFTGRKELLKVPRLGPKAYEQCAGFLRVPGGREPLDNTAVHPESYAAARRLLEICGNELPAECGEELAEQCGVGVPTLRDIVTELRKPGRDIRDELPKPILRQDVLSQDDLVPGMELTGTVRNVTDFGAFVDIGVHQDGLVHRTEMRDGHVRHPSDVVKLGDIVKTWVISVEGKRISLTMKGPKKA